MEFKVCKDLDYVQGHLRNGHVEILIEAKTEEEALEKAENFFNDDNFDDYGIEVDDYEIEGHGDFFGKAYIKKGEKTMETEKKLNIFEKMLLITSELSRVAKNLEVGFGASKYKAVGEADILAAVKPLEEKYRIYSYPYNRKIVETSEIETKSGTKNLFLRIETTYRFVNVDNPNEYIEIISYGDGVDSQDKSVGKAMTYADKYALMKAYKIMTGDDPDQNASEELKSKTTPRMAKKVQNQANFESLNKEPIINQNMTVEQKTIILSLDDKLKEFACKKYNLSDITQLSSDQAQYIINSLKVKGMI